MVVTIERMLQQLQRVNNSEPVAPGLPASFTTACTPGDRIWQGDVKFTIVTSPPAGYIHITRLTDAHCRLALGETQGAKHRLDSIDGITLWWPEPWTVESLRGPCFATMKKRQVLHPAHGAVTIPAGFTVLCGYQRELIRELAARTRD